MGGAVTRPETVPLDDDLAPISIEDGYREWKPPNPQEQVRPDITVSAVVDAVRGCNGNLAAAARLLGTTKNVVQYRMKLARNG